MTAESNRVDTSGAQLKASSPSRGPAIFRALLALVPAAVLGLIQGAVIGKDYPKFALQLAAAGAAIAVGLTCLWLFVVSTAPFTRGTVSLLLRTAVVWVISFLVGSIVLVLFGPTPAAYWAVLVAILGALLLLRAKKQEGPPLRPLLSGKPALVLLAVLVSAGLCALLGRVGVAIVLGLLLVLLVVFLIRRRKPKPQPPPFEHLRGSKFISYEEALAKANLSCSPQSPSVIWGGLPIPSGLANQHFMVLGTTGSGKTATIDLLLKSVVPRIGAGDGWRALIFDPKTDACARLVSMGLTSTPIILNPFDSRAAGWDMGADFQDARDIPDHAALLFPVTKDAKQPFFEEAAVALAEGVICSLNARVGRNWDLRDLILAMSSPKRIREILAWAPKQNEDCLEMYFGNQKTTADIMSTIATRVRRYRVVASYWHHAKRKFSLTDWVNSESILVLGHSHRSKKALQALNLVIFKRASDLLCDQPNSTTRRSWIVLDELGTAGKVEGLDDLAEKGRDKGACLVLGFQDISKVQEAYGEKLAEAIIALPANLGVLCLHGDKTPTWAQRIFGEEERKDSRTSTSVASGPGGTTKTVTDAEHREKVPILMASTLTSIPTVSPGGVQELEGYYSIGHVGRYRYDLPLATLKRELPRLDEAQALRINFQESPPEMGILQPWDADDYLRLGLEGPPDPDPLPGQRGADSGLLDGLDFESEDE